MTSYCCQWICDDAAMDSVLRAATLQDAPHTGQWTDKKHKAFKGIDGPAYVRRGPPLTLHKVTLMWTNDYMTM